MWCKEFKVMSWDISHLLQKIKGQKFSYQLKMSKYVSFFFVFIKTKLFPKVSVTSKDFCIFCKIFHVFFCFYKKYVHLKVKNQVSCSLNQAFSLKLFFLIFAIFNFKIQQLWILASVFHQFEALDVSKKLMYLTHM